MCPTTTCSGPHSLALNRFALEPVSDDAADSAPRYRAAEAGRATCAERASQGGAMEP
jgi:hypothetical protein